MWTISVKALCDYGCSSCDLCSKIKKLKDSEIYMEVDARIQDFKNVNRYQENDLFIEMCFCILTANFSATRAIQIQDQLGMDFITLPQDLLVIRLKEVGYRFPNTRAQYIYDSRKWIKKLHEILYSYPKTEQKKLRNWIAENIKGLGLKESSHFLRNIGFDDCAIIDFHIVDLLVSHLIIERPKTLTKKRYQEVEQVLEKIAQIQGISLAELDLYLWYMETGKILK